MRRYWDVAPAYVQTLLNLLYRKAQRYFVFLNVVVRQKGEDFSATLDEK